MTDIDDSTARTARLERSRFAQALVGALDETGLYSRQEWAVFLNVSTAAISQWVHDRTLPKPSLLWMVIEVLRGSKGVKSAPLSRFLGVLDEPLCDISPLGRSVRATMSDRILAPVSRGLLDVLAKYPFIRRESLLLVLAEQLRLLAKAEVPTEVSPSTSATVHNLLSYCELIEDRPLDANIGRAMPSVERAPVVYPGARAELLVRSGRTPMAVIRKDGSRQDVVGLFREPGAAASEGDPTFACMLWKLSTNGENCNAFDVDEMLFVMLDGESEWRFSDHTECRLGTGVIDRRMLWLPALKNKEPRGVPPFSVKAANSAAVGLLFLYARGGIRFEHIAGERVAIESSNWTPSDDRQYWGHMFLHRDRRPLPPLFGKLPDLKNPEQVWEIANRKAGTTQRSVQRRVHDSARNAGQMIDMPVCNWPKTGPGAILRPSLVFMPGDWRDKFEDRRLGSHRGAEVVIPLLGSVELTSAKLTAAEHDLGAGLESGFGHERIIHNVGNAPSTPGGYYPDIIAFRSEWAHCLTSGSRQNALALVVTCAAAPDATIGRTVSGRLRGVSGQEARQARKSAKRSAR